MEIFIPAIIVLVIAFVIFIIGREFMLWYWKINRMVELLEKIAINTSTDITSNKIATETKQFRDL